MELKIMTEKEEKGFSLTTPALSEDLLEQSRNSKCEKWEKWYQNINTTFCPRVSKLLQKKDSLTLTQLVHDRKQDRKFSQILICRYVTFMKSRNMNMNIPDVNPLWQSVCVKVRIFGSPHFHFYCVSFLFLLKFHYGEGHIMHQTNVIISLIEAFFLHFRGISWRAQMSAL